MNSPTVVKDVGVGGEDLFSLHLCLFRLKITYIFHVFLFWLDQDLHCDCAGESAEVRVSGANFFVISRTTTWQCE